MEKNTERTKRKKIIKQIKILRNLFLGAFFGNILFLIFITSIREIFSVNITIGIFFVLIALIMFSGFLLMHKLGDIRIIKSDLYDRKNYIRFKIFLNLLKDKKYDELKNFYDIFYNESNSNSAYNASGIITGIAMSTKKYPKKKEHILKVLEKHS